MIQKLEMDINTLRYISSTLQMRSSSCFLLFPFYSSLTSDKKRNSIVSSDLALTFNSKDQAPLAHTTYLRKDAHFSTLRGKPSAP